MGGEQKDRPALSRPKESDDEKKVSDLTISKLLCDFISAKMISQTSWTEQGQEVSHHQSPEEKIVSSLRQLHLRKPAICRRKLGVAKGCVKKPNKQRIHNKFNLSVAAIQAHRPIVWPSKLSSKNKRSNPAFLQPSRLRISKNRNPALTPCDIKALHNVTSSVEKARIENEIQRQRYSTFGGSTSFQSFSSLAETRGSMDVKPTVDQFSKSSSAFSKRATSPWQRCKNSTISYAKSLTVEGREDSHKLFYPTTCKTQPVTPPAWLGPVDEACASDLCLPSSTNIPPPLPKSAEAFATPQNSQYPVSGNMQKSCSYELRMEETNVNELASYFEDLLHIPRKMSSMAEMMYA